jgi:tripeptidyl-peptidase-1
MLNITPVFSIKGNYFMKPVYIALKQPNSEELYRKLTDISNPLSQNYSKWLTKEEVDILVLDIADKTANIAVLNWLKKNSIKHITNYGDSIKFLALQHKINNIFNISGTKYSVPEELREYIDFVEMKNTQMKRIYKKNIKTKNPSVDDRYFGRESMINIYNLPNKSLIHAVSAGSVEYQNNQGFTNADLNKQQISNSQITNNITIIVGDNIGTDTESELDVQVMSLAGDNTQLWYWQSQYWLYSMAVDFNNADTVPDVISMSWGWNEKDQCDIIDCSNITSYDYVTRVNYEYMKILLRGTTIVVSSGDAGAPGRTSEECDLNNPLNAAYPGSSEFVLSVGATFVETVYNNKTNKTPICQNNSCVEGTIEHVTNFANTSWTAGGGFNNYTNSTPYWQKSEVEHYLKVAPSLPNASTFNKNGRAYPDISLVGHSCPTYIMGELSSVDGTSCSSPLMAGVVAVINEHQLRNNRNKVGYFNPLLYHISRNCKDCFNEISDGNNWCTEDTCCDNPTQYGYQGIKGYDPVTGIGSPNIKNILKFIDTMY